MRVSIEGGSSPIVDGVGGYSEQELNEFHDVVRAGENLKVRLQIT